VILAAKWTFVTCGDWDLNSMLNKQCEREKTALPAYFLSWINLKKRYADFYNTKCYGMAQMLQDLKLPLIGRHHSGIDDCRNIARVMIKMIEEGHLMQITTTRTPKKK